LATNKKHVISESTKVSVHFVQQLNCAFNLHY